ncbi:Ionotropic glutamate receptor, partial [Trinorchestia longiramus]
LCQKSRCFRLLSDQTFVGTWVLTSYVLTLSYVSSLTATLTVPSLPPPLDTLEDLVKLGKRWGLEDFGGVGISLFKNSEDPLYQKLHRSVETCGNREECLNLVSSGGFAFISWKAHVKEGIALHHTNFYGDTEMHVSKEEFFHSQFVFALQRGSPLKRPFDKIINRLLEGGLIVQWMHELNFLEIQKNEVQREESPDNFESLSFYHLQGVFYVLGLGLASATLFFVVE